MNNERSKTRTILAILLVGVLAILATGCSMSASAQRPGATQDGAETAVVEATTLAESVESSGTVKAAQDAELTWKTNGVVAQVNAKAGDRVKAGQVLAELDLTSVSSNILNSQVELLNAQQNLQDLQPTALGISQAEQRIAAAQDDIDARQRIVDGMGTPASQSDIDQAEATVLLAKIKLDKAWDRYEPFQNKPESNQMRAGLYNMWAEAQQLHNQAVTRLNNLKGTSINPTDQELAQANLELAKASLEDAKQTLSDLLAGSDPDQVASTQARITSARANLETIKITAPFDGEVLVVDVQKGDVVNAGQLAFSLANRDQLHVDTLIDETDIHALAPGNTVQLILESLPEKILTGKIGLINPVGQQVSGNVKYSVQIDLDPVDYPLLLGATADVTIQTGQPQQVVTVPVRAIQSDDQGEFVNVIESDGTLRRVDIVSGELVGELVTILSGELTAGDQVQLVDAANQMSQMPGFPGGK